MSLKKPGRHGRVPLNSLEDGQSGLTKSPMGTPKVTSMQQSKESFKTLSNPFSPRYYCLCLNKLSGLMRRRYTLWQQLGIHFV